ncbi:MAG: hypothetical protein SNG14_07860 [Rikenellaceae bacterium]
MSKQNYTLQEVLTAADERRFIDFPKRLYRGNDKYVCPLDDDIKKIFDPKRNKLFEEGEAVRWLALDAQGEVVGRVAAFYNKEKAELEVQLTGGCGFFEVIECEEVAVMLFDASREWLVSKGMQAMDAPINFGQRDTWWGLLVNGFEFDALYENPYNPPYYQAYFENYGFQNYFNQHTYIWKIFDDDVNDMVHKRAARLHETPGYTFRTINMKDLDGEAEKFRTIYNKAWAIFEGVKPMERHEAAALMQTMKPIIDPEIIFFGYYNDEPISFFIMVPDLNRLIGKFNGKFGLWQKLQLMWDLKVRRSCDRIFGVIFAVTPELRGKGVESAMMQAVLDQYIRTPKNKYQTLELAWMGDFNPVMCRMVENYVGATKHKMHTTYRYLFDRTLPFERCPRIGMKRS